MTTISTAERDTLNAFLDLLREAVVTKASGLTDEQARQRHVPSEQTTIAGLVGHLAYVESYWFGVVLDEREDQWEERFRTDNDAEFTAAQTTPIAQLISDYRAQCEISREIAAKLDLDFTATGKRPVSLRWVLVHMIEETGRHAGHVDLLRELTDGLTGS